jgi:hypothetical protein
MRAKNLSCGLQPFRFPRCPAKFENKQSSRQGCLYLGEKRKSVLISTNRLLGEWREFAERERENAHRESNVAAAELLRRVGCDLQFSAKLRGDRLARGR